MRRIAGILKALGGYWRIHYRRLISLGLTVLLGAAGVCSGGLLIRSEKMKVLDSELTICGNYELAVYMIHAGDIDAIRELESVEGLGAYYEAGSAGKPQSTYRVRTAAFADSESEEIYYMPCVRGRHPIYENEISLDSITAKKMGIIPEVGNEVELTVYDPDGNTVGTSAYTISGIFESCSSDSYGGDFRYPDMLNVYEVPKIFMSCSALGEWQKEKASVFIQSRDKSILGLESRLIKLGLTGIGTFEGHGRKFAYSYVLGIDTYLYINGEMNFPAIFKAIKEGKVVRDFYSAVMMPVFMLLLVIMAVMSINTLVRDMIKDRAFFLGVLRSQGITAKEAALFTGLEITAVTFFFCALGVAAGCGVHCAVIWLVNRWCGVGLGTAFDAGIFVRAVTLNPYASAFAVIFAGLVPALLPPLVRLARMQPISMLKGENEGERVRRYKGETVKGGWRKVLGSRLRLHSTAALALTVIIMSTAVFGYTYIKALLDKNHTAMYGMKSGEEYDYLAFRDPGIAGYDYKTENRHDCGIDREIYEELAGREYTKSSYALMENSSTKLTRNDDTARDILKKYNARRNTGSEDAYQSSLAKAQNAALDAIGYPEDEEVYCVTTVGLPVEELDALDGWLVGGSLNKEELAAGHEVIIAVSPDTQDILKLFEVGNRLPLSDIVLSETEDMYDFADSEIYQSLEPVYSEKVFDESLEEYIDVYAYAFGKRKDIDTKIGALAVIDDSRYVESGFSVICADSAFGEWGLPDSKYTEIGLQIRDGADMESIDAEWMHTLSECAGTGTSSYYEVWRNKRVASDIITSIFFTMISFIVIIGSVTLVILLRGRIRMNMSRISRLRAIGMSTPQLTAFIAGQTLFYPLIGAALSVVPSALCQCLFLYIRKKFESGDWDSISFITDNAEPWYSRLPYRFDLYSYDPGWVVGITAAAALLLFSVLILIQSRYSKKNSILDNMENNKF